MGQQLRGAEESSSEGELGSKSKLRVATLPPVMSTWWRHKSVLEHLGVDAKTLRIRMNDNPEGIPTPWINVGSARRPDYRWMAEKVDKWWYEVNLWRVSISVRETGESAGVTLTARPTQGSVPTKHRPNDSRRRSKQQSQKADVGSLATYVRSRISGTS